MSNPLNKLSAYQGEITAILRITTAWMFLLHGTAKIFKWPAVDMFAELPLMSFFGAVGILEIILGVLVLIGWQTRIAAFLASGMMAIAYWGWHALEHGSWFMPLMNGGEPAALFCFIFLFLAAAGPGKWSLDGK
ncbi:DoxX family protein [Aliidiomarina indica]|uniref:DoxX family protein n=1 Tax=Aliidiomarina indica TaxID=2749147 RepID=UPI00188FEB3D|nr:DoxX family protein [Aliidiomarina indica]